MNRTTKSIAALVGAAALASALFGCAAGASTGQTAASASASANAGSTPSTAPSSGCDQVAVVINFGPLNGEPITACVAAGPARDVLGLAGAATEGTVDYGDQVVCRVNGRPASNEQVTIPGQAPFTETCATLSATAYWAVWVKTTPGADWEYAQEGVSTLELTDGQSLGLVYTPGADTVLPQG